MRATFSHLIEAEFGSLLGDALLAIRSRGLDLFHHRQEGARIIEMYRDKVELKQSGTLGEIFRLLIFHTQLQFLVEDHAKNAPRPKLKVNEALKLVPLPRLSATERYRFLRALCRIQIYRNVFTPPETSLEDYQKEKKKFWATSEDDYDETWKLAYRVFFEAKPHWENAEIGCVLWYMQRRYVSFYEEIYNDMLDIMIKRVFKGMEENKEFPSFSQDVREVYDRFRDLDMKYKSNEYIQGFFELFNHRIDVMKKYQPEGSNTSDKTSEDTLVVLDSMVHARVLLFDAVKFDSPADVFDMYRRMLALAEKYEYEDGGKFESLPEDVRPSVAGIRSLETLRRLKGCYDSDYPSESLAATGPDFLYRTMHADPLTRRHMILAHATGFTGAQKSTLPDGISNIDLVDILHPEGLHMVGDFQDLWQTLPVTEQPNIAWKRLHVHGERDERLDEAIRHLDYQLGWRWSYALWDDDKLDSWGTEIWV